MRGIIAMALVANMFGWAVFSWLIVEDSHWQMPWFVAPLLIAGVIFSGIGVAVLLLARSATGLKWGVGIIAVSTLSGIAMLVVAWGEAEGWAEAGAAALPLVASTHAAWIGTLVLILLAAVAMARFSDRLEAKVSAVAERAGERRGLLARVGGSATVAEIAKTYVGDDIAAFGHDDDRPGVLSRALGFDLWWAAPLWIPYSFLLFSAAGVVADCCGVLLRPVARGRPSGWDLRA